ncbi:MAG TPA: TonB-dependent receptor [Kofleriaceae bacterium]|nr:TonB-dependent receptor [Kofleriaceae bacterium]
MLEFSGDDRKVAAMALFRARPLTTRSTRAHVRSAALRTGIGAGITVLAATATSMAAPVTGNVFNGASMQPVANATITADTGQTAVTDRTGAFTFADLPPGPRTFTLTRLGLDDNSDALDVPTTGIDGAVFLMFEPGQAGELVEVKGEAPAPPPIGKQSLSREEITRIPGTRGDALQSLRSLPGVSTNGAGGPGLLVIRGSNPDDSYIAVDGIQVPILYHFFGLQSVLPSEFIQNIEFSPGGFGVEEGRATGGVINVVTRDEPIAKPTAFAELSFINAAALMQTPLSKKHNLQMSAAIRRSLIDFILPAVLPDTVKFTAAPTYYDAQLRIDWRPKSGHRLTAFALGSLDNLELLNNNLDSNDPVTSNATFRNETGFVRLITTWEFGRGPVLNRLVASTGFSEFKFYVGDRYLDFGQQVLEARDDFNYRVNDRLRIRSGAMARLDLRTIKTRFPPQPQEGEPPPTSFSTGDLIELNQRVGNSVMGAYTAVDIRPTAKTTFTSGLRLDYYNHIGALALAPRTQLSHQVTPALTLRASLGAYNRGLEQSQSVPTNLSPERATQYIAAVEYKVADGVTATATGFYTDRQQLVVRDPVLAKVDIANSFVNRGTGRSFGGEALVRLRHKNLFGWLAYTLQRSDRVDQPLAKRRLFDADQTHNLVAVASYKYGKWEFGAKFQYATAAPQTPIIGSTYLADANIYVPRYGDVNSVRGEAAHQLDLRIDRKWKFASWELSAFLDVTNVYMHARVLGYNYNFDYSERIPTNDLPIFPALGVRGTM